MKNASILGVPLDLGAKNLGVDIGPNAFRDQNIKEKLETKELRISDLGNISCNSRDSIAMGNPKLKYLDEIVRVSEETAKKVYNIIKKGNIAIALGGDHSISLGTISGASAALKGNLGVLYLDGHGDINTDKTTETGNIHGMHLASLMGFGNKKLTNIYNSSVKLKKDNLLHIGGNDFDRGEIEFIQKEKIKCYQIIDILTSGLGPLFDLIENLQSKTKNIWVSLDLDVVDNIYAPGVGIPNRGGLTYREIAAITQFIGSRCNVVGLDMVEYNPLIDIDGKTSELGIELIAKLLGVNYDLYTAYLDKNRIK